MKIKINIKEIIIPVFIIIVVFIAYDLMHNCFRANHKPQVISKTANKEVINIVNRSKIPNDYYTNIPNINGTNKINALYDVIYKDETKILKNKIEEIIQSGFIHTLSIFDEILYRWAEIYEINPNSRLSEDGINYIRDARRLHFIEKFDGKDFVGTHNGTDKTYTAHQNSAPYLIKAYNDLYDMYLLKFLDSSKLKIFSSYNITNQCIQIDDDKLYTALKDEVETQDATNVKLLINYINKQHNFINKFICGNKSIIEIIKGIPNFSDKINNKEIDKYLKLGDVYSEALNADILDTVFYGRQLNDTFNGSQGDDVYIYAAYDGIDTINEIGGNDSIIFIKGIEKKDIIFIKNMQNLVIGFNGNIQDKIIIKNYFLSDDHKIENIIFDNKDPILLKDMINQIIIIK